MTLALLLTAMVSFADSTQHYYATRDVQSLSALCAQQRGEPVEWLCRYRLYPLTEDEAYLDDLPTDANAFDSPQTLALISGLWGYRAARGSIFTLPKYGRRSTNFLERAKEHDPNDPFVLLVEGQSLLFRPGIVGGDKEEALERFKTLQRVLPHCGDRGISSLEADLWVWYTMKRMDHPSAPDLKQELLDRHPPPLYAAFIADPP
ncbi:MAG: hypothetical protein RhofKO_14800 [Rhodothermales bacterium]